MNIITEILKKQEIEVKSIMNTLWKDSKKGGDTVDIPYIPDGDPDELRDLLEEERRESVGHIDEEDIDYDSPTFPW